MRRKLFFWLEKLKITRAERHAVMLLVFLLTVLLIINAMTGPSSPFDDEYYSELEEQFLQRTALLQQKEQKTLDRYKISGSTSKAAADTLPDEPVQKNEKADKQPAQGGEFVNINAAGSKTLQTLTGIGGAYAARIIAYRQENGAFKSKDDLMKIKGIGPARLGKIAPYITLGNGEIDIIREQTDSSITSKPDRRHFEKEDKVDVQEQFVINVNTADAKSLQKLSGIGPAYAARIVEYRQENGSFVQKNDLLQNKRNRKKAIGKNQTFYQTYGSEIIQQPTACQIVSYGLMMKLISLSRTLFFWRIKGLKSPR